MKQILVLVDFTKTANIAIEQATSIASENNAFITICHIAKYKDDKEKKALLEKLKPYSEKVESYGIEHKVLIGYGKLFSEVTSIVDRIKADLVVVGTHGIRGVRQNLFGADIYKLVKGIHAPTLVVNDRTRIVDGGFKKALLPVAPHADYLMKVKQTCQLLSRNGIVTIFAILKPGMPLSEDIVSNIESTKQLLTELNVQWEYQEVDSKMYSVGYAKETLIHGKQEAYDLISIMTNTSLHNAFFGKMDKQNVLVNNQGLPVLCANY